MRETTHTKHAKRQHKKSRNGNTNPYNCSQGYTVNLVFERHFYGTSSNTGDHIATHSKPAAYTTTILFGTFITRTSRTQRLMNDQSNKALPLHSQDHHAGAKQHPRTRNPNTIADKENAQIHILLVSIMPSTWFPRGTLVQHEQQTQATTSPHTANQTHSHNTLWNAHYTNV